MTRDNLVNDNNKVKYNTGLTALLMLFLLLLKEYVLLVLWESDNSISIVSRNSKSVISTDRSNISFKWPQKGIFKGKIILSSGNTLQYLLFAVCLQIYALYSVLGEDTNKEIEQRGKEMVMCEYKDEESISTVHLMVSCSIQFCKH